MIRARPLRNIIISVRLSPTPTVRRAQAGREGGCEKQRLRIILFYRVELSVAGIYPASTSSSSSSLSKFTTGRQSSGRYARARPIPIKYVPRLIRRCHNNSISKNIRTTDPDRVICVKPSVRSAATV